MTVDGYFSGLNGGTSWAHTAKRDPEFDSFVSGNAKTEGVLGVRQNYL